MLLLLHLLLNQKPKHRAQGALLQGMATLDDQTLGCRPMVARFYTRDDRSMDQRAGHRALRKGRVSLPGQIYLLTTTTAQRSPLFRRVELANAVARCTVVPSYWTGARLLCWVLMPDHWHALVELEGTTVSGVMNRFKSITSKQLRAVGCATPVWARGFHDHALRRDENVLTVARYIIANPLRAGLVDDVLDYPWWNSIWLL